MMKSLGGIKEHPILFSTEMVRAILDGKKTQTRRVIKPKQYPIMLPDNPFPGLLEMFTELAVKECPYGQVGDRLWVREKALYWDGGAGGCSNVVYQDDPEINELIEDNNRLLVSREILNALEGEAVVGKWLWRPSIFMPRWASRINLEITGVRVERVRDISNTDAYLEGVEGIDRSDKSRIYWDYLTPYQTLWDSINGKIRDRQFTLDDKSQRHWVKDQVGEYSWASNPWVWVVEFKRLP